MTTLYRDPQRDYLIVYSTVDGETLQRWKGQIEDYMKKDEKKEKGYWNQIQNYLNHYFDSSYAEPYTLYHALAFPCADLLDMFPVDKKPIGHCLISYRRYQLTEEKPSTAKGLPFSLTHCIPGDEYHSQENYRMSYAYDRNSDRRYREYTALFCIQRDEGVQGGTLIFYPQHDEESTFSSTLSDLLTQCSLPRKELEVPFPPGAMVLLSGSTWYSMEPLRGKGTCLLMMVDFFTAS